MSEQYTKARLERMVVGFQSERDSLAAELAISKGREEAKQLVINQLEAALRFSGRPEQYFSTEEHEVDTPTSKTEGA